jgi:hypothetical protein
MAVMNRSWHPPAKPRTLAASQSSSKPLSAPQIPDECESDNAAYPTKFNGYLLPPRSYVQVADFRGDTCIEIDVSPAATA